MQSAKFKTQIVQKLATSRHPGKVVSCSLQRQKDGGPSYRVVIVANDGGNNVVHHVWVNATDGQIIRSETEH